MGKVLGNANKAYVKVSSGSAAASYAWLGGEQDNSVDLTAEAVETSDKTNDWASFLSGKKGATIAVTVHADTTDPAQEACIDALVNGAEVDWGVGTLSTSSITSGLFGKAIVTGINFSNNVGAVATRSINLTATGEVTTV